MPFIRITGLPTERNVKTLLHTLRAYLRTCEVEKFWINEITDTRGTDLKEAGIEVSNDEDGYVMESFLNKVPFKKAGIPYFLKAEIVHNDYQDYRRTRSRSPRRSRRRRRSRERSYDGCLQQNSQERDRSRSPLYQDTTNDMDVELQFLRKKRQLIEEERKLIAEKKKLEMMKEYGASSHDQENMATSRDRDMRSNWEKTRESVNKGPTLPLFVIPCRVIMKQMKAIVMQATRDKKYERMLLLKLINGQLRRRIALALNDSDFMPASAIVDLYRSIHPKEEDEAFVANMLNIYRLSIWPSNQILVNAKKTNIMKKNAGPSSGIIVYKGKKAPKMKITPAAIKNEVVDVDPKPESCKVVDPAKTEDQTSTVAVKDEMDVIKSETPTTDKSDCAEVIKSELDVTANEESTVLNKDATDWAKDDMTDMVEFDSRPDVLAQASNTGETGQAGVTSVETAEEDDWVTNGVDWDDDDDESKEDENQEVP